MSSFFSFKVVDTVTDGKEEDAAAMALHSSSSDSAALLVLIRRGLHQRRHQPIDCREYHNLMIFVHIQTSRFTVCLSDQYSNIAVYSKYPSEGKKTNQSCCD